jgi:hypothetical protein
VPRTPLHRPDDSHSLARVCVAGLLAWLLPGAGHIYLGHRGRGVIYLVTIAATFWGGIAIAGVHDTVNPQQRFVWFIGQLCTGSHALVAIGLNHHSGIDPQEMVNTSFMSVDIGVVYTGVAGLLNLLAILDALARADAPPVSMVPVTGGSTRGET